MIEISEAIKALDPNADFVIYGEVTNETEYQQNVKYVSSEDANGTAIFSETQPWTWTQVSDKQQELQADYDAKEYQRNRAKEYPTLQEQLDLQYHDQINGTTKWKDKIKSIKDKYPKETE